MRETPITFKSDGQQLVGMLHVPDSTGPFPAVLFLHGFTGSKIEAHRLFVEQARALAQAGIASLRFDFRGCGDSAGEFSEMTIAGERADTKAALRYLARRKEIDAARIGLLGMSMGGLVAAFALADQPEFKTAVLWNPVAYPKALRDSRMTPEANTQLRELGVVDNWGWAVGARYLEELGEIDPLAAIRNVKIPILLVGSTADETVPFANVTAYHEVLQQVGTPCVFHSIQGASHAFNSLAWTTEVLAITLAWFGENLGNRS